MDITEKFEKLVDEHHQKDANGEPIPHDDEEGISEGTALQVWFLRKVLQTSR